ncbi:MAG: hypothetical protein WC408_04380 [Candidatus Micrarchaeia archaeon]|jgi:hypothetical protein
MELVLKQKEQERVLEVREVVFCRVVGQPGGCADFPQRNKRAGRCQEVLRKCLGFV